MKTAHWLALVTDAFGGRGGIAQFNRDFLGVLSESASVSSVTVLPRYSRDQPVVPSKIFQTAPHAGKATYAAIAILQAFVRRVDIVFCGHLHMVTVAAAIARLKGAKLVIQMHGIEAWPRPSWLRRMAVEAADLVLCVSRHTRARVVGWAAIAPERVLVLPNTVADVFVPGDGSALRAELGLDGKQMLLTVGRMDAGERYKGHERVIAALPRLLATHPELVYLIVGEGNDRARLEKIAQETGVEGHMRFFGNVEVQRLADLYRMADLLVMPSTGEGFGIVFLELMASGTPALGLNVAGARDALGDNELGTLAAEENLAEAIGRLLSKPRRRPEELSNSVRVRFGSEAFQGRVRAALDRLCTTR